MKIRSILSLFVAGAAACSGGSPVKPDPVDPGPVVNNSPPVIRAFTIQGTRSNEPANFADVSEEIPVKADVGDEDSAISDLKFNWSATAGTFSGTGAEVRWKAPDIASTPMEVRIDLEVIETYRSQGRNVENKVAGSAALMLHDSIKEVSAMARQFLLDFSDSRKSVTEVMRNFAPDCHGTAAETSDVTINRQVFEIVESNIGEPDTSINFGGICRFRSKRGDACSRVSVYWRSRFVKDNPQSNNKAGDLTTAWGTDHVAAMYYRDQKRWKLCDSQFEGTHLGIRGLVP